MSLSRSERRAANKAGGYDANQVKSILDTERERLRKEFQDSTYPIVRDTVDMYTIAMCTVLHDKFGFGHERLRRALTQINDMADSMTAGYVSVEDCRQMLVEDVNIQIGGRKNAG